VPSAPAGPQEANITIVDGSGATLWAGYISMSAGQTTSTFSLSGLRLRFIDGLVMNVGSTNITNGQVTANLYFSVP